MVTFDSEEIRVTIAAKGSFVEQIPLVLRPGDTLEQKGTQIIRTRGAHSFLLTVEGGQIQTIPRRVPVQRAARAASRFI